MTDTINYGKDDKIDNRTHHFRVITQRKLKKIKSDKRLHGKQ